MVFYRKPQSSEVIGDFPKWIHDYRNCRNKQTQAVEVMANYKQVTNGVPQGSVPRPRLISITYTRFVPDRAVSNVQIYSDGTIASLIQGRAEENCKVLQTVLKERQERCKKILN